ncbi:DUF1254 domain-containing protein [Compostimonas suwonensis]|uniref:DUF1254 domain-containing protein n=1 Tax=Compostimonas suwonensis TaxID=1048394 RepID=A0A2M9BCF7_9MICO|nr:DUF1254 domain-containing protein [Compostimonas suwonensis]PJJ55636.1 hypothetical protein CLV54_2983 [Compostimonas suwonensis]
MQTVDDDRSLAELAAEAYLVGFPLVFDLEQALRNVETGIGAAPAAPYNTFSRATSLAGPQDTFVSINNDTVYLMSTVDLSVGPLVLHVPDTQGRYYVLQFVSAWTDNFAYIGLRATGTAEAEFLLVPAGWHGDAGGRTVVEFPTRVGNIVGRIACDGESDLLAVRDLQEQFTLTPLTPAPADPEGIPTPESGVAEGLDFWEKFRVWLAAFPAAPQYSQLLESFAPLGLLESRSPYIDPAAELAEALRAGMATARQGLVDALHSGAGTPEVDGWKVTTHIFDYNDDYFGIGTIDSPEWRISDLRTRIGQRAAAALAGLWGNHGYEASYPMTYVDSDGEPLHGSHSYRLRLAPTPPVSAFWSLTMYDLPDFFLVSNEIERYSLGDRTTGIVEDDDGAITITMSHVRPTDPAAPANWLPAPDGLFRPILRLYGPGSDILDGRYTVPAIERADE